MPCYTEEELLSIGEYLRVEKRIPEGMEEEEYSEASIKQRFYQSGGIIRHIFPESMEDMEDTDSLAGIGGSND
jgi:hypothetical protein